MRNANVVGKRLVVLALGAAMLALGGCGTVSKGIADDGRSAEKILFPAKDEATFDGGTFVNLENLKQVSPGMTKDQLYALLGRPHFHEGVFGVREWDYLFNFHVGHQDKVVQCEFKVLFDTHDLAQSFYWNPDNCADLLSPPPAPPKQVAAPKPLPPQPIRLSADALFAFDKSNLSEQGQHELDTLLQRVRDASHVQNIEVVGYTDRIGAQAYNMKLSQARADTVRGYLVDHGVSADAIQAEGRGESDPLVQCPGKRGQALIACLGPNRRVEISGRAMKRRH